MKLTRKSVIKDDDGLIVGSHEVHYDEADVARVALDHSLAMVRRCFSEANAADRSDRAAIDGWLDRAQGWAYVALVADQKWPGQLNVDQSGDVTGVRLKTRPLLEITLEPLTIKAVGAAA